METRSINIIVIFSILLYFTNTHCYSQYKIDTLHLSTKNSYLDSAYLAMKRGEIKATIESTGDRIYFNLRNSRTHFSDVFFFKKIDSCACIVVDQNYMKPENEIDFFSLKRDSTLWTSSIDSLREVITIKSKSHEILFLKIIHKTAGEDFYYYDILIVDRNTCEIYDDGFMLKTVAWKDLNDHTMVVYEECSINLYTKDGNLFVDRFCSKSKRYKEKQTFIFSETLHKFIEYSP